MDATGGDGSRFIHGKDASARAAGVRGCARLCAFGCVSWRSDSRRSAEPGGGQGGHPAAGGAAHSWDGVTWLRIWLSRSTTAPLTGRCAGGNGGRYLLWADPAHDLAIASHWGDDVEVLLQEVSAAILAQGQAAP